MMTPGKGAPIGSLYRKSAEGSRKFLYIFTLTEQGYSAQKRELLAVLHSLRHRRSTIEGAKFLVRSDHQSLRHLHSQKESARDALVGSMSSRIDTTTPGSSTGQDGAKSDER
jgi:hypothetical protein